MRPTRWWLLAVLTVVAAGVGYALTRSFYGDVQSPPRLAPLWVLLLALAEAYTAGLTRARLAGRPGTKPINALVVARLAALAKASSPVGALVLGGYAGFLVYVARATGPQPHADTRTAVLGVGCSIGLVASALALERVCRVKPPPGESEHRT